MIVIGTPITGIERKNTPDFARLRPSLTTNYVCTGVLTVGGNPLSLMFLVSTKVKCSLVGFILMEQWGDNMPLDLVFASLLYKNDTNLMDAHHVELVLCGELPGDVLSYRVMYINEHTSQVIPTQPTNFPINVSISEFTDGPMKRMIIGHMMLDVMAKNEASLSKQYKVGTGVLLDWPILTNEYAIFCVYCDATMRAQQYHVVFDRRNQCVSVYRVSERGPYNGPQTNQCWGYANQVKELTHHAVNKHKSRVWLEGFHPTLYEGTQSQTMSLSCLFVAVLASSTDPPLKRKVVGHMIMDVITSNEIPSTTWDTGSDVILKVPVNNNDYNISGMHYHDHNSQSFVVFDRVNRCVSVYHVSNHDSDQNNTSWGSAEQVMNLTNQLSASFANFTQKTDNVVRVWDRFSIVVSRSPSNPQTQEISHMVMDAMAYNEVGRMTCETGSDVILYHPVVTPNYGIFCINYPRSYLVFDQRNTRVFVCHVAVFDWGSTQNISDLIARLRQQTQPQWLNTFNPHTSNIGDMAAATVVYSKDQNKPSLVLKKVPDNFMDDPQKQKIVCSMIEDVMTRNEIMTWDTERVQGDVILNRPAVNDEYGIFSMHYRDRNSQYYVVFNRMKQRTSVYHVSGVDEWGSVAQVSDLTQHTIANCKQRDVGISQWVLRFNPFDNNANYVACVKR